MLLSHIFANGKEICCESDWESKFIKIKGKRKANFVNKNT